MKNKGIAVAFILVLLIAQGALHRTMLYDRWSKNYAPKNLTGAVGLSPDQMLFALAGFREMIAGILWVRADAFFDRGNFDAILPIIRLVTILDPNQIDVYATGMWHIAYNFTDEDARSDRRYLPSALSLGIEGSDQNSHTYELFFETGWLWHHKIEDNYPKSVEWLERAISKPDVPDARRNLLHVALQRDGRPLDALEHLFAVQDRAAETFEKTREWRDRANYDTITNNIDTTLVRLVQRGYIAQQDGRFDEGDYDTKPPFDVNFTAKVTVIEPRVLRVEGTWGVLPVGTRLRFIVRDFDLPNAIPGSMKWDDMIDGVLLDPPKEMTYLQDQLFVRNRRFNRRVDMSKDPTMYPLEGDKYLIEFYYNARQAPAHIQDKFGWNGEGMTDKYHLSTDAREGQRAIYASFEVTRDQLVRAGEWTMDGGKTPVFKTEGFVERTGEVVGDDIIVVPSLRSDGA